MENFFNTGFGFLAVMDNEICGLCYSSCVLENRVEIYIETREEYKNRGLGTAMAKQMVRYCLDNELVPEWEALTA